MADLIKNRTETPRQHSILASFLLHLVPGILILAGIFLFSQPFVVSRFRVDTRLAPLFGYLLAILFVLIPVQFRLSRNRPASVSLLGLMQILPEVTFQEHR